MKESLLQHLQQRLLQTANKQVSITGYKQVYGGDINTTYIITTNAENYFVKLNNSSLPGMFEKEYNGLQLLQKKSDLQIPKPIAYGSFEKTSYLLMECLEKSRPTAQTWKALGEGLAALHRQTQMQFGLREDNYIGSLPQANYLTDTWAEFYTAQRILPLAKKALEHKRCTATDVKEAEKLCGKFANLFPEEPPALLHGDLWSGNVMACAHEKAAVYDPAVYYGHREMDIAMTLLFGGFDSLFYHHYNEVYPLQKGWQDRVKLCQLYPLLVHLHLFGGGYYERVKSILNTYK